MSPYQGWRYWRCVHAFSGLLGGMPAEPSARQAMSSAQMGDAFGGMLGNMSQAQMDAMQTGRQQAVFNPATNRWETV